MQTIRKILLDPERFSSMLPRLMLKEERLNELPEWFQNCVRWGRQWAVMQN